MLVALFVLFFAFVHSNSLYAQACDENCVSSGGTCVGNNCVFPPTPQPTGVPTPPTQAPTKAPTPPTFAPTKAPTQAPTPAPTTATPTQAPTTLAPTVAPTTAAPTPSPTNAPTPSPTAFPTPAPTASPTPSPTAFPTIAPTPSPTPSPTQQPTASPTGAPTPSPTAFPTPAPTPSPTPSPTASPTALPTEAPTSAPTSQPTALPTSAPTDAPTGVPTTLAPTQAPTLFQIPLCGPACDAINGTCVADSQGFPVCIVNCASDADCPDGSSCVSFVCTVTLAPTTEAPVAPCDPDICSFNGGQCIDGICTIQCTNNSDCPVGMSCPNETICYPNNTPTEAPTFLVTPMPTTESPTSAPTEALTSAPTPQPTEAPTFVITPAPTTPQPTEAPTPQPTEAPTPQPTPAPTPQPTPAPTSAPTPQPTPAPTRAPTPQPTPAPTPAPTTRAPTNAPTTKAPTKAPTVKGQCKRCTFTQGGYGSKCPQKPLPSCSTLKNMWQNGQEVQPGCLRDACFTGTLVLGNSSFAGGKSVTFTGSSYIMDYAPGKGTPSVFTVTATNPKTTSAGVFGGQLLAAMLNQRFAPDTQIAFSNECNSVDPVIQGRTVVQVIYIANQVIGRSTAYPMFTPSILSDALSVYNEAFVGCKDAYANKCFDCSRISDDDRDSVVGPIPDRNTNNNEGRFLVPGIYTFVVLIAVIVIVVFLWVNYSGRYTQHKKASRYSRS